MQSHTPSFWLWDDPEACRKRFELVHGLQDKRERSVHTAHLPNVLGDRQKCCLVKTQLTPDSYWFLSPLQLSNILRLLSWVVNGCDGASSTVCAKSTTQPKSVGLHRDLLLGLLLVATGTLLLQASHNMWVLC